MTYKKTCGNVSLEVSAPWPTWAVIRVGDYEVRGLRVDDLRDLRHLLGQAIPLAEKAEAGK